MHSGSSCLFSQQRNIFDTKFTLFPAHMTWQNITLSLGVSGYCSFEFLEEKLNLNQSYHQYFGGHKCPKAVFLVRLGTSWERANSQLGTSSQCFFHIPCSQLGTSSFSNWLKIHPLRSYWNWMAPFKLWILVIFCLLRIVCETIPLLTFMQMDGYNS